MSQTIGQATVAALKAAAYAMAVAVSESSPKARSESVSRGPKLGTHT